MNTSRRLRQARSASHRASVLFLNKFLASAIQIPIVIFLSRTFGPSVVGEYAFAQAIVIPMMFLASMRHGALILTDARRERQYQDYFVNTGLLSIVFATLVGLALALSGNSFILPIFAALAVFRGLFLFSEFAVAFAQKEQDFRFILQTSIIRFIILLATFCGAAFSTQSLFWGLAAMAAAQVFLVLALELPWILAHRQRLSVPAGTGATASRAPSRTASHTPHPSPWPGRMDLLVHAFPLGIAVMFASLTPNSVRFIIAEMLDVEQLGYFAAVTQFLVILRLAVGGASNSILPRQTRKFDARDGRGFIAPFAVMFVALIVIGGLGAIAALAVGDPVLELIYGPAFVGQAGLLAATAILAAFTFIAQLSEAAALTARITRYNMYVNAVGLVFTVVCTIQLIPHFGLYGVQMALGGAAIFQTVAYWLIVAMRWRTPQPTGPVPGASSEG
ncbi:MAG: lipopolysaccharide biosynthesis protein [Pseudomonadota bacterium]